MADTRLTGLLRRLTLGPAAPGPADREALRAFIDRRDEAAFAGIVRRHGPMVLRVCRTVLHHTQDAEDACQATFLVLARKAAGIGRGEGLASWLHGVAYRTALRARRAAGRRRARERDAPVPARPDPAEAVAWRDVQMLLEAEIRRLPARYRSAFVLCYLDGWSRAEAAADLGLSENTLSSRLARARERLRVRLARRGVHLSAVLAAAALTTGATAAVPAGLCEMTARAAAQFAARRSVTGVSSFALQLTNGTIQTMTFTKLKWAAGLLAVGGTLAVGSWGAGQGPGGPTAPKDGPVPKPGARAETPATGGRTADYVQRQRSLKNLKQILLAMHNYHDAHGRFPTDVTDADGKPVLSWRVELLPYLEQDALYKQFKPTEPWDSEHNLALLAKMPEVFRVGFEPAGATHTYYQRFAIAGLGGNVASEEGGIGGAEGPAGAPPGAGVGAPPAAGAGGGLTGGTTGGASYTVPGKPRFPLRMAEITDGTSNTVGVIEAGPPVPWTKPADFTYDPKKPLPRFVGPFTNVRNAAALDGTVYGLKPDLDEKVWHHLIGPNDGNVVPAFKTLTARFAADSEDEKKALAKLVEENQALIGKLEEQLADLPALLALTSKLTKDLDRAEEEQTRIKQLIDGLKALNKKMRDDLGLRPGATIPKGQ